MTIKEIASISGMSGLYKVLKPSKSGVIVESLDANQKRLLVSANQKVSLLDEISIYTINENVPLIDVLRSIKEKVGDKIKVSGKSDNNELKAFMKSVLPDYDEERVYVSDIKKVVSWYIVLLGYPTVFEKEVEETEVKEEAKSGAKTTKAKKGAKAEDKEEEAKEEKPAAKKATKTATAKPTIKPASAKNMNATATKAPKKVVSTKKAG
jgi:hypothetical protein